ncbi:PIN domain-containing protein [Candidatus Woesearchaeota archaeon]|nr:PIN domain-containing protein [Candidatus Woesearchaeota archaeon]
MKCLDASVVIEIFKGNPYFIRYTEEDFIMTDLTLAEACAIILKQYNEKTSDYWFRKFYSYAKTISADLLYEAVKFRWKAKHKKLSFFDATAYIFARKYQCTLVTMDNDFRHLPGVEFIRSKNPKPL